MKRIYCLIVVLLLMTGCASADVDHESYFITESAEGMLDDGYVIVQHDLDPPTAIQTLCPGIQGVSSVRAHNPSGEVIVDYADGCQKTFSFEEVAIDIEYMTKTHSKNSPCFIRSDHNVYVYDTDAANFSLIADDFLFYLESHQEKYFYVNTAYNLVDSEGNIYCENVVGIRADSDTNHTVVYVDND